MKRLVLTIIILVLVSLLACSSISLADDATLDFWIEPVELYFFVEPAITTFTIIECPGTEPYKAEWDCDADGEIDVTVVGAKNQIMLPVKWRYNECGLYSVILTVTDSTSTTFREEKLKYIIVSCCVAPGDVNADLVVNIFDITYLEMIIAGLAEDIAFAADVNGDFVVNSLDVTYLEMMLAGLV